MLPATEKRALEFFQSSGLLDRGSPEGFVEEANVCSFRKARGSRHLALHSEHTHFLVCSAGVTIQEGKVTGTVRGESVLDGLK